MVVRELLASAVEVLLRVGCQFWDCPGPDEPFEEMRTCYVCVQVQALREALSGS